MPTKINFVLKQKFKSSGRLRKGQADSHFRKVENKQVKQVNTLYSKRGIGRKSITL